MNSELETIVAGYLDCAVWASSDEDGESLDSIGYGVDDIEDRSISFMVNDCVDFLADVDEAGICWRPYWEPEQFGHDFWLTRNRHGAGFWDRYSGGEGYDIGRLLTNLAHGYGESNLMREDEDDNGGLYVYPCR